MTSFTFDLQIYLCLLCVISHLLQVTNLHSSINLVSYLFAILRLMSRWCLADFTNFYYYCHVSKISRCDLSVIVFSFTHFLWCTHGVCFKVRCPTQTALFFSLLARKYFGKRRKRSFTWIFFLLSHVWVYMYAPLRDKVLLCLEHIALCCRLQSY